MSLDPRQQQAVDAPGSVLVTAGAGTGKTYMLARRYLHHVRQGLRPIEVVAVTFTRRAAEELRARVRSVVEAAQAEARDDFDADVLAEVEAAPIGTIHALAQTICRRYPEAAGVPPDFGVVDELDGAIWVAEALDEALARLRDADVAGIPFDVLRNTLKAALEDPTRAYDTLMVDALSARAAVDEARRTAYAQSVESEEWRELAGFLASFEGPDGHKTEIMRAQAVAASEQLTRLGDAGNPDASAAAWSSICAISYHVGAKSDWQGPDLATVKAAGKRLRELAREAWQEGEGAAAWHWGAADERNALFVSRLKTALERGLAIVDERKRRARALSFADLETHALRALEQPDVRADVHRRWRALLVDEVQDVNPTQARLLTALQASDAPLTAVGDAKQSIYGFRGAEPAVLRSLHARIAAAGGQSVALATSYRTHAALVDTINRVFDRALKDEAGPLQALREGGPTQPLRYLMLDGGGRDSGVDVAEAQAIANNIQRWLDPDDPLRVPDAEGGTRPLELGDIAILARSRTTLATLEAHLPTLGVPVLNAGGGDVLQTQVARDARALLRAVIDPTDGVAHAAVVRSPYVAGDDRTITEWIQRLPRERGTPPWWRQLPSTSHAPALAAHPMERLAALLAALRQARQHGARASDLLLLADDLTGFVAHLAHLPQGPRRVADHDGVLDLCRRLEGEQADALGVVRRLERLVDVGVKVPRPPLRASGAVALLTMHAAKGLEWPAVIVADLAGSGKADQDDVLMSPRVGFALRWSNRRGGYEIPSVYRLALAEVRARDLHERRRLAYVAFTRAREVLLVSDRGGADGGLRAALGDALTYAGIAADTPNVKASGDAPPPLPPEPDAPNPSDPLWRRGPGVGWPG